LFLLSCWIHSMKEPTGGRLVNLFVDLFDRFVAPGLRPSLLHHLPGLYSFFLPS